MDEGQKKVASYIVPAWAIDPANSTGCASDSNSMSGGGRRCVKCGQHWWSSEIDEHERTCEQRPEDICRTCNVHRSHHDHDRNGTLWLRGGSGGDHQFNRPFPAAPWVNTGLLPQ
jgi:hypothetical protein